MARKTLVLVAVLALSAGALFAVCTTFPNSRVTEFDNNETACAGTGQGCRECITVTETGVSSCWADFGVYHLCSSAGGSGPIYY